MSGASSSTITIQTPRVYEPLLHPARYKGAHGGRGSGKSHFFAEMLVEQAIIRRGLKWVCIREVQKSLEQSVKRTIEDKIEALGLGSKFKVKEAEIETPGDGLIIFQGMQNHTADSIKSLEGYDGAWVEEAQSLSSRSLRLLRPTIRKADSELWFSWNPESPEDPVDQLLRGENKIKDAVVVEANWSDNPWFPDALKQELISDRTSDEYEHIWNGAYRTISDAIIFSKRVEIRDFQTPENARFFYGADFGFAVDPSTIIRSFINETENALYIDHEAFGHKVELDDLPALYDTVPLSRTWPIKGDCSRPETISHLRSKGFNISGASKWQGSVEDGITHLKGFKKIVIHERCPNMAREARRYSYKVDAKTEQVLPVIVDRDNHGWDAVRYSLDGYIKHRSATVSALRL